MCEPTFEEWFFSFAGELAQLSGEPHRQEGETRQQI